MLERDVVILGGGPGGSTLASCLAKRGRNALLLERDKFPRFHIGESLLPHSCEVFRELGLTDALDERFIRKYGARFHDSAKRTVRYDFSEAFEPGFDFSYQVPRADFDHLLLQHAVKLGAEVREEWEATDVLFEGDRAVGVRAEPRGRASESIEIRARVVVDATGRDALLASRHRRKAKVPGLDKTALFTHYRGVPRAEGKEAGDIHIVVFEHGWFWMIPFRDGTTSIGAVCSSEYLKTRKPGESLDELYLRTAALSPVISEATAGAERLRPAAALADFSYRIDQLAGDGWLFVGDAAGFLDPLFSTGAHLAIKGAQLAAEAIDAALHEGPPTREHFAEYERQVRSAVDLFLGIVQGFYRGPVQDAIFDTKQRAILRRLITSILSGDVFHRGDPPTWASFVRRQYPADIPQFA
jgi:flavin-dependent dehydrogenase